MRLAIPVLLLAGCGVAERVPVDEPCREVSREDLPPEAPALGGLTAGELLAAVEGERAAVLTWSAGGDTPLHLELRDLGPVARVQMASPVEDCGERLAIPATVLLRTGDGKLDETIVLDVYATEATTFFDASLDVSRLDGTYEPRPGDVEGEHVELGVRGDLMPAGGTSGEIGLFSWSCDGEACGGGGGPIATWSPVP